MLRQQLSFSPGSPGAFSGAKQRGCDSRNSSLGPAAGTYQVYLPGKERGDEPIHKQTKMSTFQLTTAFPPWMVIQYYWFYNLSNKCQKQHKHKHKWQWQTAGHFRVAVKMLNNKNVIIKCITFRHAAEPAPAQLPWFIRLNMVRDAITSPSWLKFCLCFLIWSKDRPFRFGF